MNAATYQFYTESYFGNEIAAADFNRLIARAKTYLDSVKTVEFPDTDAVRMAQCAVAEAWQKNEQGGDVVSQSVGGWSQSFAQSAVSNADRLFEAAKIYISDYIGRVRWV